MSRLAIVLVCLGQTGCFCGLAGDDAGVDAGIDAGRDAGPRDAGRDAGRAAPRDAGRDAGYRDVGVWGSGECPTYHRGDGGFERFDFLPVGCDVYRATAPEEVFGRLCWQPCRDGRAGCEEMSVGWATPLLLDNFSTGSHDGTHGYAYFITWLEDVVYRLVVRDDGSVLAAWRNTQAAADRICTGSARLGPTHAAFILRDGTLTTFPILYAPLGEIGMRATPLTTLGPAQTGGTPTSRANFGSVSATHLAIEQGAGTITRTAIDGTPAIVARGDSNGAPGRPYVVGTDVFYTQEGPTGWNRILVAHADGSTEIVREAPETEIRLRGADERELVWTEASVWIPGSPYQFARVELWRAPFTADPRSLRPTRVRRLPETLPGGGALGFGHFIYEMGGYMRDVDLASGEIREVVAPEGMQWLSSPAYSGPDDILLSVAGTLDRRLEAGYTLLRLRHDSLDSLVPPEGEPPPPGCPGPGCVLRTCPPRADCSTFAALRGAPCELGGYYCMCTGADRCVWYCGDQFEDTRISCSAAGLPTTFP